MRMDSNKISFAAVAQGGTIAEFDASDVFQVGLVVNVSNVAGAPTNFRVVAIPVVGAVVLGSATEHIRRTADMTAAGIAILGQRSAAVGEPAFENVYPKIRVIADFTAGTAPNITGDLYIFTKRW